MNSSAEQPTPGTKAAPPSLAARRGLAAAGLGALALVAAVAGGRWWQHNRFVESTDDAYVQADSSLIAPKIPGYVARVLVQDNQPVRAGDLLATLDDRDYRIALDKADAQLRTAHAELDAAQARVAAQASVIAKARAAADGRQAGQQIATLEAQRYRKLADIGYGSQQAAQQAAARLNEAAADLQRDQAGVEAARHQARTLQTQVEVARGRLAVAEAARAEAALNLAHTRIVAPLDGVIGRRSVRVGQLVQPGNTLMAVVPAQQAYVVANFKETQLARLRPGQSARLHVDAYPDKELAARVDSIAPASGLQFALLPSDNATGNFTKIVQRVPVKLVLLPNPSAGLLRPGMSVEARIDTADAR